MCFANNKRQDQCGVCFGNSTTCLGCDGIPASGLVFDNCFVCGGNGATCFVPTSKSEGVKNALLLAGVIG